MSVKSFLLSLLLLACCLRPALAQDSSGVSPVDGKDVVVSPEKTPTEEDDVDRAYRLEADSVREARDTATYAAANDRAAVRVRSVDANKLGDIRADRDYRYGEELPPTASWWDRLRAWFWHKVGQLFESKAYQNIGQYLLLAGIAALVIWLLYKAEVLSNLFPGRAKNQGLDYETLEENIHVINFSDRIGEAVENQNYRLAVRLLYLQTLKSLTDGGLINWQPDKTNRQYAYELTGNAKRLDFERLTTQFEYVWYGDFPVDEARFGAIRHQFNEFNE